MASRASRPARRTRAPRVDRRRAAHSQDVPVTREPVTPEPVTREPVAPPPAAPTWRDEVVTASGLNLLLGLWLIAAPWAIGYATGDPFWNDPLFGALIAIFALVRVTGAYRASWMSYANAFFGAWLLSAGAFWLDVSGAAFWNDIACGGAALLLALWSATTSQEANRRERVVAY